MSEFTQPKLKSPPARARSVARVVSDIFNPVFVGIFITGVITFKIISSPAQAARWFGLTVALTALPPLVYILYLVKTGYLADIYMPDREKRVKPVTAIFIWLAVSVGVLKLIGAPAAVLFMVGAALVQIALLGGITLLWKISFHSATIMAAAVVTVLLRSELAWVVPLAVPLVGWARIAMRRHTFMQVVAGYAVGCGVGVFAFLVVRHYFAL